MKNRLERIRLMARVLCAVLLGSEYMAELSALFCGQVGGLNFKCENPVNLVNEQ